MEAQETGRKDIEKVGGLDAYNRIARKRRASFSPDEIMELMRGTRRSSPDKKAGVILKSALADNERVRPRRCQSKDLRVRG